MVLTIDVQSDAAVEWHLTDTGVRTDRNRTYTPTMYVGGEKDSLDQLRELVASDPKVQDTAYEPWFHSLDADQQTPALRVDLAHVDDVRSFAHEVRHHYERTAFRPTTFRLYNVDFLPQFRYCLETGTDPTPPRALRTLRLTLGEKALADGDVSQLRVGGDPVAGDAATVLRVVNSRLTATDPDVLVLSSARLVPLLSTAAERDGLSEFALGRRPGYTKLAGESTFESYGRVGHSPARYKVPGRAIIDTSNSFLHGKAGLPGLLDLVERSWKPLQETAWGSIGNILTAIQIREALARDMLIPWNKWDGEAFKSVETLHAADRGGFIFEPAVGIHEDVVEIDFASLYPNIMCEYNVSPETVDCDCHDGADVPGLGYAICEERGFIPDVLRPLIDDRERFKGRLAATDDPEQAARLAAKADALRWILVSCFGYQGYRNAKFGRIECHEAINAFAREILLDAKETLEANGWRIVHGIVDSLWVTARSDADQVPIRQLCERISEAAGIRLEYENTFDSQRMERGGNLISNGTSRTAGI